MILESTVVRKDGTPVSLKQILNDGKNGEPNEIKTYNPLRRKFGFARPTQLRTVGETSKLLKIVLDMGKDENGEDQYMEAIVDSRCKIWAFVGNFETTVRVGSLLNQRTARVKVGYLNSDDTITYHNLVDIFDPIEREIEQLDTVNKGRGRPKKIDPATEIRQKYTNNFNIADLSTTLSGDLIVADNLLIG